MDVNTMIDTLPSRFTCWLDYYSNIILNVNIDATKICFREVDTSIRQYECDLDFIKARCFDEIIAKWKLHKGNIDPYDHTMSLHWFAYQFEKEIFYISDKS